MTQKSIELRAPAKVNLFLTVVGRRDEDGFHYINSLILPVDLFDRVKIRLKGNGIGRTVEVDTNSGAIPSGPANLAYRAAQLFIDALAPDPCAIQISIEKNIPAGSGLGGGSSDAAAVLNGLNRLYGTPFPVESLASMGARIGADVPVFVYGRPAQVSGVGEIVCPVLLARQLDLVVASDLQPLSTKEVYSKLEPALTTKSSDTRSARLIRAEVQPGDLVNHLEHPATQLHPGIQDLKNRLREAGAQDVLMSGSGSAVFGLFAEAKMANKVAENLRSQGLWAKAVQTLSCSPIAFDGR